MALAEEDQHEPPLQLPPEAVGDRDLRDGGERVLEHLDEADAAVGGADLVLDAALEAELLGLDPVGEGGDLVRERRPGVSMSSAPRSATATAAEVPVEQPAGAME